MAVGSDGRYYGEAKLPKAVRDKLADKQADGEVKAKDPAPKPEANTSVDPATHPAAGGEKKAEAVKDFQKK